MDIYLPIAEISVNGAVIVAMGLLVGFLSGMFGVGGGFLTTPLLIFYGIPPAVAVASSATQITGASVSGALAHWRRGGVDPKMGAVLIAGGVVGSTLGSFPFRWLQQSGQIDTVIALVYVAFLGSIGLLMLRDSIRSLAAERRGDRAVLRVNRHNPLVAALPWKTRFYASGLYISPLAPFLLGAAVGVLTVIMGVGGGFILVPAMIYLLGMQASVVIGTSLFQIIFVTAATTVLHAWASHTVDIVMALLLAIGGVFGATYGARFGQKLKAEQLRGLFALLVVIVAIKVGYDLTRTPPDLYSIDQ